MKMFVVKKLAGAVLGGAVRASGGVLRSRSLRKLSRYALAGYGATLVSNGTLDQVQFDQIQGAVMVLAGLGWSYLEDQKNGVSG